MGSAQLVFLLVAQATVWPVAAAEREDEQAAAVHLFVVGATAESVRPVVDAFSRRDANLRLTHVVRLDAAELSSADQPGVAARAWIEVSASGHARIAISDRRSVRFLLREATLSTWPDEVARETVVQLVESSVAALLEDEALGMGRAQALSRLAIQRVEPASPPTGIDYGQRVHVFYQGQLFAPGMPASHGPGLGFYLVTARHAAELAVGTSLQYVLPQRRDEATVGVALQAVAWRMGIELAGRFTTLRIRVGVLLGAGVDAIRVEPRQGTLGVATLTSPRFTAVTVLRAQVAVALPVAKHVALSLVPSCDFTPSPPHYDVAGIDGSATIVAPYRMRPGLSVGVVWQ
jgi:hypothetical protein